MRFPGESRGHPDAAERLERLAALHVLFGQGLSVNALQAAGGLPTIANDGVRVAPRWSSGYRARTARSRPAGRRPERPGSSAPDRRQAGARRCSRASSTTRAPRRRRRSRATGWPARPAPPSASTRTCGCYRGYTASFIGFAPADDPRAGRRGHAADGPIKGHFGGIVAAPVFQDVMTYALQALEIPPTGTTPPDVKLTPDSRASRDGHRGGRSLRRRRSVGVRPCPCPDVAARSAAPGRGARSPSSRRAGVGPRRTRRADHRGHPRLAGRSGPATCTPPCPAPTPTAPRSPAQAAAAVRSPSSPTPPGATGRRGRRPAGARRRRPARRARRGRRLGLRRAGRAAADARRHRHQRQDDDGLPARRGAAARPGTRPA